MRWEKLIEALKLFCRCIDAWRSRALSFSGRAVVLNSLALSKIWYIASVIAMPKSGLKELNTRIFIFFWAFKKDLVARKVLHHSKSEGGFSVVSVELKIHSLLGQWFRRFGVSPGAWVSLLTFWCFDRFGISPMSVFAQPSAYDITTLRTFFCHCFLAWIALFGSFSGGELVVGSSLSGGPLLVSTMTTKTCYDLLLSRNPALPIVLASSFPFLGIGNGLQPGLRCFFCPPTDK